MPQSRGQVVETPSGAVVLEPRDGFVTVSQAILRLAEREGVDLAVLLANYDARPASAAASTAGRDSGMRLLDWPDAASFRFKDPEMAARFFEEFVLYPGLVIRGWDDPAGRLAFTLDMGGVAFELHVPGADLLIRGTPTTIRVAVGATLPDTVCAALIGEPLERLVAWPPATGPDYLVTSISEEGGLQVVTLVTDPVKVAVGAGT